MLGWKPTITTPISPIAAKDRRKFLRIALELPVRFLSAAGDEFAGRTIDIAAGGLAISTPARCSSDEELILYVEGLGRIPGRVARDVDGGFAVAAAMAPAKRDKIADQLTWLLNRGPLNLHEERAALRRRSAAQSIRVEFDDVVAQCQILDISVLGVGLQTEGPRPTIGSAVVVGQNSGVCARYMDKGFAVEFRSARVLEPGAIIH